MFEQPSETMVTYGIDWRGVRDGSVVVRCCHTRYRAQVRILGRLMVLFIPDSHLLEIRIMAVTMERKDGSC